MWCRLASAAVFALLSSPAIAQNEAPATPFADYHQHLFSPAKAATVYDPPLPRATVPHDLAAVIHAREQAWRDAGALAPLFTRDALFLNTNDEDAPTWIRGRERAAEELAITFAKPYRITPVAYEIQGDMATIAAYYTRGDGDNERHFGHALLTLRRNGKRWQIAAEVPSFPGPPKREASTADELIAQLDDAGIKKAVVLSVAYQWGSTFSCPKCTLEEEYARVRNENDYTAREVARYADRLIGFCSVNPMKPYAIEEIDRCGKLPHMLGLKLHLGNSRVDIRRPEQATRVREIFRAANERRMPIVIHLWNGPEYEQEGATYAKIVLEQLLPAAPDVVVQIAHMAGGSRATPSALAVFAEAIAAGDPRTKNLYFDTATITAGESAEGLRRDAAFIRTIGPQRILYGTDTSPPNPPARVSWGLFRGLVPLSDSEFRIIASNVAPYLRQ